MGAFSSQGQRKEDVKGWRMSKEDVTGLILGQQDLISLPAGRSSKMPPGINSLFGFSLKGICAAKSFLGNAPSCETAHYELGPQQKIHQLLIFTFSFKFSLKY